MDANTPSLDDSSFWTLTTELFCSLDVHSGQLQTLRGAWEKALGFSAAEVQGEPFSSFVHSEDVDTMRIAVETIADAQETGRFTCRVRSKEGTIRHIEWTAMAGPSSGHVQMAGRDITELMTAKKDAQFHEELMGQVAKGAPVVIAVYDRDGTIRTHIGAGLEKLGLQQNQLRGVSVFDALKGPTKLFLISAMR